MNSKCWNMIIATMAGTGVGLLVLILAIPTLFGMLVGNDLNTVLSIRRETGWGLAMGLLHSVPAALVAARVAIRREANALRDRALLAIGVGMSLGTLAGTSTSTALWILKPLRVSPQGPPILHMANFVGIAMAALCSAAAVMLVATRTSSTDDGVGQTRTKHSVAWRVMLWSLMLWSPLVALSFVVWGSQPMWDPVSFNTRQLNSVNRFQRFSAVYNLNEQEAYQPEVIQAVAERLNDEDSQVREKAREYLLAAGRHGTVELSNSSN